MARLHLDNKQFLLDGEPFRILSGAIHYFRVVPEYWRDRLLKLKACGLNTVETYVAWNVHEPRPGEFDFCGRHDLVRFIETAQELGLFVILRPGPYICAEWEFGGLPAWLLKDPGMQLRCSYPPYLQAVDRFFDELIARVIPLQSTQGGPIIAVQVENEYGSYGNDQQYLRHLQQGLRNRGVEVLLFTSDGPTDGMLQGGTLPDVLKTVNFASDPQGSFGKLREYQPNGPLMCTEFWDGWFDYWGEEHHTKAPQEVAQVLDAILEQGASVNFYMFYGGTNFGFTNGALLLEDYQPQTTSYDYDAPLNEAGDPTPKYFAIKEVLAKHGVVSTLPVPPSSRKKAYGSVPMEKSTSLFQALSSLSQGVESSSPPSMEQVDQNYGFILYRTHTTGPREEAVLKIHGLADRAHIFLDGELQGILERAEPATEIRLTIPAGGAELDILVENMGRVNYGPHLKDPKGILGGVQLANQYLYHWMVFPLPLEDLSGLCFGLGPTRVPAFFQGDFVVDEVADTFVSLPGWTKGVCYVNGSNLGRYWNKGPQQTLYLPGPLLRQGENQLVVFELDRVREPVIYLVDTQTWGNPNL